MGKILTIAAYVSCSVCLGRLIWHVWSWMKAQKSPSIGPGVDGISAGAMGKAVLDVILFRRLFRTSRLLWAASWTFHISFFLVLLRHSWYVIDPVPDLIIMMEPAGVAAGYLLSLSLVLILIIRIVRTKDRYLSYYNFFLLGLLLTISSVGLLMRTLFQPDINDVKDFIFGIMALEPYFLPGSGLFVVHFLLVLILITFLPFHLITAPVTTIEARRREEGLDLVMHEK